MIFKTGVPEDTLKAPLKDRLLDIEAVMLRYRAGLVITSTTDGKHMEGSKHYDGLAIDIRSWEVLPGDRERCRAELARVLGPQYDVIYEKEVRSKRTGKVVRGQHYHIEVDEKTSHHTMQENV